MLWSNCQGDINSLNLASAGPNPIRTNIIRFAPHGTTRSPQPSRLCLCGFVCLCVCFVACLCAFVCTVFCSLKARPHRILVCAEIGGDTEKWVGVLLASPADCAEPEKEQKSRAMTPTHPPSRPPTQAPGPGRRQLEAPVLCQRPRLPGTLAQRLQALQLRLASGD